MKDFEAIRTIDYNYNLPDERIAKFPLTKRDSSKLLIYNSGKISHNLFTSLPEHLPSGALMVFNNTKVIQARLHFRKEPTGGPKSQGALIEIFLLEPVSPADYQLMFTQTEECTWHCLVGNLKRWKEGSLKKNISIGAKEICVTAERIESTNNGHIIKFRWNGNVTFAELLEATGEIPIPPYLNRESQESDKTTYQTVYSKIKGSVAAPTAGLHFTDTVLSNLDSHNIEREELTLHVGAGTFKPVKSENIAGHEMHTEYIVVRKSTIEKLIAHNGEAIAVGTTSVRTLESLYYIGVYLSNHPDASEEEMHVQQWTPYNSENNKLTTIESLHHILNYLNNHHLDSLKTSTCIIIVPGYKFHIVKMMVTNFHQPQSTLLLLVSAFVNGNWKEIYNYALENDFRFLSYGDSSLLIP
ncbi:MAG: S-adenosylmethionine:tRNA ribosyltransferase-isomerase [Bacteroidaceae bacterium]|nr:S-adenosylmethionine:tRNA ribosyltransferase-isomerase [Bacteroidaceae bacterium]